jgi:hypothetical protein
MRYEDRQSIGGVCVIAVFIAAVVLFVVVGTPVGLLGAGCFLLGCKLAAWVEGP